MTTFYFYLSHIILKYQYFYSSTSFGYSTHLCFNGGKFCQWGSYLTEVLNEVPIKVGKTQKPLQVFTVTGLWSLQHCLYFFRVCLHLPILNDITQKAHWGGMELEFLGFSKQLVFQEPLQKLMNMENVFIYELGKDQHIIKIHKNKRKSVKTLLTMAWRKASALVSQNGITRYSKWPKGVLNAVFHSSPSLMRTRW